MQPPIWKRNVNVSGFAERNKEAIRAEEKLIADEMATPTAKAGFGTVKFSLGGGLWEDRDAEGLEDDPVYGGIATEALFKRDAKSLRDKMDQLEIDLSDPEKKGQRLTAKEREEILTTGAGLKEIDPVHAELKAKLIKDDELAAKEKEQWESKKRLQELGSMGISGYREERARTRLNSVATVDEKLKERETAIAEREATGISGKDLAAHAAEKAQVAEERKLVEQRRSSVTAGVLNPTEGYGNRPDGTKKGTGYLGALALPDGSVATEYSTQSDAVKVNGSRVDFPTLVPTLSPEEVKTMTNDIIPNKKPIPEPIMRKAIDHANGQIAKGSNVFAEEKVAPLKNGSTLTDWDTMKPDQRLAKKLQDFKLFSGITQSIGIASDKSLTRNSDGSWDTPAVVKQYDNQFLNAVKSGVTAIRSKVNMRGGGTAEETQDMNNALYQFQKENNLSDQEVVKAWNDFTARNNESWQDEEKLRVLSDGEIILNTTSTDVLDRDKLVQTINSANSPDDKKAEAISSIEYTRKNVAEQRMLAYEAAGFGIESPSEYASRTGRSASVLNKPDFILEYEQEVLKGENIVLSKTRGLATDVVLGFNKLATTVLGVGAWATGSETLGQLSAEGSEGGQVVSQGKPKTGVVGSLVQETPSLLAMIVASQIIGAAGAAVGASAAVMSWAARLGSVSMAGAQSLGATYADERAQGKTHEEAGDVALRSGVNTSLITGLFNMVPSMAGFEKYTGGAKSKVADVTMREIFKSTSKKELATRVAKFTRDKALVGFGEGAEEGIDTLTSEFINATPETNLSTAWKNAVESVKVGALIGVSADVVGTTGFGARDRASAKLVENGGKPLTAEEERKAAEMGADLEDPDKLAQNAAVLREIESVRAAAPEVADRVSGAVKLAQGKGLEELTAVEIAALGINRDGTPLEGSPNPPMVEMVNGKPVLLDAALVEMEDVAPSAKGIATMTEGEARAKFSKQKFTVTSESGASVEVEAKDEADAQVIAAKQFAMGDKVASVTPLVSTGAGANSQGGTSNPPNAGNPAGDANSATPVDNQQPQVGLNSEANKLLDSIDDNGALTGTVDDLKRVAAENGVTVTDDMTPADIVEAIRANLSPANKAVRKIRKKRKGLASVLTISNDPNDRAYEDEGQITINPDRLMEDAMASGMTEPQALKWIEKVIDEELRHVAQYRAAQEIYKNSGDTRPFKEWRESYYKKVWEKEFVATGNDSVVSNLYGKGFDGLEDWQKAVEGIRMMWQQNADASPTEIAKLWTKAKEEVIKNLRAMLNVLKSMASDNALSDEMKNEITLLQKALKDLESMDPNAQQSTPNNFQVGQVVTGKVVSRVGSGEEVTGEIIRIGDVNMLIKVGNKTTSIAIAGAIAQSSPNAAASLDGGSDRVNISDLKNSRGQIGNQGFTAESAVAIINYATGKSYSDSNLKDVLNSVKGDPAQVEALKSFIEATPIVTSELPDGAISIDDGHHRAFLADQLGMTSLPTISPEQAKAQGTYKNAAASLETESKPSKKISYNFTVATENIPSIKQKMEEGKFDEVAELSKIAVTHSLSDMRGVTVNFKDSTGWFADSPNEDAYSEPSSQISITYKNDSDLPMIKARMADIAELFSQNEMHELSEADIADDQLGKLNDDGTQNQLVTVIKAPKVSIDKIEKIRKSVGIKGLTVNDDGSIEIYNTIHNGISAEKFTSQVKSFYDQINMGTGGAANLSTRRRKIRVWSKANTDKSKGLTNYQDNKVRDGASSLISQLAMRLPSMVGKMFKAPIAKRSYVTSKDYTPTFQLYKMKIADAYESAVTDDLANPNVRKAYEELQKEIYNQYIAVTEGKDGIQYQYENYVRKNPLTGEGVEGDLYDSSADVVADIRRNRLRVLKTDPEAFGPKGSDFSSHPLLQDTGLTYVDADGKTQPILYNDMFRAVHDTLAHGLFSDQFGAIGEEAAWAIHSRTIDNPWARWALTTETRGQNSWVNEGPQMRNADGSLKVAGDEGYLSPKKRDFAVQKATLLPIEFAMTGDPDVDAPMIALQAELEGAKNNAASLDSESDEDAETNGEDLKAGVQKDIPMSVDKASSIQSNIALAGSKAWARGRDMKISMQKAVLDAAKAAGVNLSLVSPQLTEYLSRVGLNDALFAIKQNPNAVGWYDEKTKQAIGVMGLLHPELNTDEDSKFAFIWALACTSNGQKVNKNFELAEKVYSEYKSTGLMPSNLLAGNSQDSINKSLELFNSLKKEWGISNLRAFMQTRFSVGEIGGIQKSLTPQGEHSATIVRGSAIIGPKVGNGFFSNLYGYFDALTMDRWLVRTWGRWTGTLIDDVPNKVEDSRQRLLKALDSIGEEGLNSLATETESTLSNLSLEDLSAKLTDVSTKPAKRLMMMSSPVRDELRKSANSYTKYLDGQKEAPSGPTERNYIREIFGNILTEMRKMEGFENLEMADLQAVLWYAEKRLYENAKDKNLEVKKAGGYDDTEAPDYANAAVKLVLGKGVSQRKINYTLKKYGRSAAAQQSDGEVGTELQGEQRKTGELTSIEKRRLIQSLAVRRARSDSSRDGGKSPAYSGISGADGKRVRVLKNLGVSYETEWKPNANFSRVYRTSGMTPAQFVELQAGDSTNATKFKDLITVAKKESKYGAAVYVYSAEEYAGMRLFLSKDGSAGMAIKNDGDIVSVFSRKGSTSGSAAMALAITAGGRKLDAFDTSLPQFYANHGFVVVSRIPFSEEFKPEDWDYEVFKDYNNGRPDVVFMVYDPNYNGWYSRKDGKKARDADNAGNIQRLAASKVSKTNKNSAASLDSEYDEVMAKYNGNPEFPSTSITPKKRVWSPIVRDLLQRREDGEKISKGVIARAIDEHFPSYKIPVPKSMGELPSQDDVLAAVWKNKREAHEETMKIGLPTVGEIVTVRQDVPAMTENDPPVGVVTTTSKNGNLYLPAARILNPDFQVREKATLKIALGGDKGPHIVIKGAWAADQSMPADLENWTQVGFNPDRHSYYYERGTNRPVIAGEEAFQIGNTVFVRGVEYGDAKNFNFAASLDTDYLAAVAGGDMDTAQKMVDDAARAAGYNVGPVWHSTPTEFNTFAKTKDIGFHFGTKEQAQYKKQNTRLVKAFIAPEGTVFLKDNSWDDPSKFLAISDPIVAISETSRDLVEQWESLGKERAKNDLGELPYEEAYTISSKRDKVWRDKAVEAFSSMRKDYLDFGINSIRYDNVVEGKGQSWIILDPSQIKSAEPVTYDADGNVIPLSQRFNPNTNNINNAASLDTDYLAAVAGGDMDAAQKIVDDAAKAAGYDTGVFHGTAAPKEFTKFRSPMTGIWTAFNERGADPLEGDKARTLRLYADKGNFPIKLNESDFRDWQRSSSPRAWIKNFRWKWSSMGYSAPEGVERAYSPTSVQIDNYALVVFDPSRLKSAEPVTRDKKGKIILPSERFNPENDNINNAASLDTEVAPFYSQLAQVIDQKMPKSLTPEQAIGMLGEYVVTKTEKVDGKDKTTVVGKFSYVDRDRAKLLATKVANGNAGWNSAHGIKEEEVKWSGIEQALDTLKVDGKVTKESVLKYLANEGAVRFEEVMLGEMSENPRRWAVADVNTTEYYATEQEAEDAADEWRFNLAYDMEKRDIVSVGEDWSVSEFEDNYGDTVWGLFDSMDNQVEEFDTEDEANERLRELEGMYAIKPLNDDYWVADPNDAYDSEQDAIDARDKEDKEELEGYVTVSEADSEENPNKALFAQYVLEGGENYREVVLAMPNKKSGDTIQSFKELDDGTFDVVFRDGEEGNYGTLDEARIDGGGTTEIKGVDEYRSSHFTDVPNYVAHMRLNERDGGLFIEELQSDRHQAGRKQGYAPTKGRATQEDAKQVFGITDRDWSRMDNDTRQTYADEVNTGGVHLKGLIADAPFRTTWHLALFKRALRDAVASGKTWIGWTTGETQNDRFDLSKQVGEIRHWKSDEKGYYGVQVIEPNGQTIMHEDEMIAPNKLADLVGKDVAQRIVNGEGDDIGNDAKSLSGDGLKVGGTGMKGFYDNMLVKDLGKYVKQWGAKVEKSDLSNKAKTISPEDYKKWYLIQNPNASSSDLRTAWAEATESDLAKAMDWKSKDVPIWRIDITPEMRATVKGKGQALFAANLMDEDRAKDLLDQQAEFGNAVKPPNRASMGNENTRRVVDAFDIEYEERRERETREQWVKRGKKLANSDRKGLIENAIANATGAVGAVPLRPEDIVGTQIVIEQMVQEAGNDYDKLLEAGVVIQSYRKMRSDVARVLASGWDRLMKPEERNRRFLSNAILTLPAKVAASIDRKYLSPTQAKAEIRKKLQDRLTEIEKALKEYGVTINEVLGKQVYMSLDKSGIVRDIMKDSSKNEALAMRMHAQHSSAEKIAKATRMTVAEVEKLIQKVYNEALERMKEKVRGGATLENSGLAAASVMSEAEIEAEARRMVEVGLGISPRAHSPSTKALARKVKPAPTAPQKVNWARPEFTSGLLNYTFDSKDLVDIKQNVQALVDATAAKAKVESIEDPVKRANAEKMLASIEAILKKYGTDISTVVASGKPLESYRFDITDRMHVHLISNAIRSVDADWIDKATEYGYFSLLSGLQTMMVNASSVVHGAFDATIGRGFEIMLNAFINNPMNASLGETKYMLKAMGPMLARAKSNFLASYGAEAAFFEQDILGVPPDLESLLEGHSMYHRTAISGKKGRFLRIPTRLLLATDEYVKVINAMTEVGAMAYRICRAGGLKPDSKEFDDKMKELVNVTGSLAWQLAAQKAYTRTFTGAMPSQKDQATGEVRPVRTSGEAIGSIVAKVQSAIAPSNNENMLVKLNKTLFRMMFFPFVKIPYNITALALTYTPLSLIDVATLYVQSMGIKTPEKKMQAKAEVIERMSRVMIGGVITALLLGIGEGDDDDLDKPILVTGSRSYANTKKGVREAAQRLGLDAYSISWKLPNGKRGVFHYGRYEPVATIISSTVDTLKQFKQAGKGRQTYGDAVSASTRAFADQLSDKTFLSGLGNFYKTIMGEQSMSKFVADKIAMLVPNLIKQPLRELDPYYRAKADTIDEEILAAVFPYGIRQAKVDIYGKKSEKLGSPITRLFDFTDSGSVEVNKIDEMLWRYQQKNPDGENLPSEAGGSYTPVKGKGQVAMTDTQARIYRERAGANFSNIVRGRSFNYADPTDEDIKNLQKIIEVSRASALTSLKRDPNWK